MVPKGLDEGKFQALVEKTENSIKELHRPISHSGTATTAEIGRSSTGRIFRKTGPTLDIDTFEYINVTKLSDRAKFVIGKVSSYNSNTYKGRIYVESDGRPIPFTLAETTRDARSVTKIVRSLSSNAINRFDVGADIEFDALTYESKNGRLKGYLVTNIR